MGGLGVTAAVAAVGTPKEETWGMAAAAFAKAVRAKAASVSSADIKLLIGDTAPKELADALQRPDAS